MFRFENTAAFNWLLVIPLLLAFYFAIGKSLQRKLNDKIGKRLLPFLTASQSKVRQNLKFNLQLLVIACLVFALARPQLGQGSKEVKSEGTQIVFMFDVSTSMLAQDVAPSRLEFAKKEVMRLIDALGGDKVGIVAFAGSAALLSPMTSDKSALKMLVDGLSTESISSQGTFFEKGLRESWQAFKRASPDDEEVNATRVVIVASDGEDNEPGALSVAEEMAKEGIRIFVLGFGTENGAAIPVMNPNGGTEYKRDRSGKEVISKFTPNGLQKIAEFGKGTFYHVNFGSDTVGLIREELSKLQKAQFDSMVSTDYAERYQWLLAAAILFALFELVLKERRSGAAIWRGRYGGTV